VGGVRTVVMMVVAGCTLLALNSDAEFPRDPERTLERLRGGRIRVGVVENGPWAVKQGENAVGVEAELVRRLARQLNATPEWHWGGEQAHMQSIEHHQLDLVIGGITKQTPWKKRVGVTDTYYQNHILVAPPGENGWIKLLDEFLAGQRGQIPGLIQESKTS
jgi:polar amino acid transport system substrate-binding protein